MNTALVVLPKLVVTVEGKVKKSNLPAFQEAAKKYVSQINRVFNSDETFGQAEVDIKDLKTNEELVKTAKVNIISQTVDIDEALKTLDFIGEGFRTPRLEIEKEVKEQKDSIKIKLMKEASDEIEVLETRLNEERIKDFPLTVKYARAEFYTVIKGLRSIDAVKDSILKEKEAAMLALNTISNDIQGKLLWFREQGHMEYKFLFGDMDNIIHHEAEGFKAMVTVRISNHRAAEKEKEDKARERIRLEEETKARVKVEAEARDKIKAEDIAKTPAPELTKEIPATSLPKQITEEENVTRIARIRTARALCDTFLALCMSLEDVSEIRLAMLAFLQKTDWVE